MDTIAITRQLISGKYPTLQRVYLSNDMHVVQYAIILFSLNEAESMIPKGR